MQLTARQKKRQRARALFTAWSLAAMAVLFFVMTIVRLGANVANRAF